MFYVYILKSKKTGKYYYGQTNNLIDRIQRHNGGRVRSTKHGKPWRLVYALKCESRSEAVQLELELKQFKNPEKVLVYLKVPHEFW